MCAVTGLHNIYKELKIVLMDETDAFTKGTQSYELEDERRSVE